MPTSANIRAFCSSVLPWDVATDFAILIQCPAAVDVPAGLTQKRAMFVWSSVRVELVAEPIAFTSLNAAMYSALVKAGGPSGFRNCEGLVMAQGVIVAH